MAWILAVDDEEGIRNLIQNALEKDGHRVSVCKNTEVIKEKDLIHYDLILLDIMMPGTDGITWCKRSDGMWTARFISDSKSGEKVSWKAWFRWR